MSSRHAFSLIELLVVVAIISLLVAILFPAISAARDTAMQIKDAAQVRGIMQAMIVFSNNNKDSYPNPTKLDAANATVNSSGQKNLTGHILSILIFQNAITPEICVSPVERNEGVLAKAGYEYVSPAQAYKPAAALWDPTFRGTPFDPLSAKDQVNATSNAGNAANQSYAHLPVPDKSNRQRTLWKNNASAITPILGNRGPAYTETSSVTDDNYTLVSGTTGVKSRTLLMHGGPKTWEGNIAYNDGHVKFEISPSPKGLTFATDNAGSVTRPDNLFINEKDDAQNTTHSPTDVTSALNAYLRPTAGFSVISGAALFWRD